MSTFTLKGSHVLAIALGFLAVVVAANAIFITLAVKTFPGQVVEKPYERGVHYNDELAAKERQAALGWKADIRRIAWTSERTEIVIRFSAASGDPLHGLKVAGLLARPVGEQEPASLMFAPSGDGEYVAIVDGLAAGAWDLSAVATASSGEEFVLKKRLLLE